MQSPNRQVGGRPLEHFYDQIAWFTEEKDGSKPLLSLRYTRRAGLFDGTKTALADSGLTSQQKSFRISDHHPLWAEFDCSAEGRARLRKLGLEIHKPH